MHKVKTKRDISFSINHNQMRYCSIFKWTTRWILRYT